MIAAREAGTRRVLAWLRPSSLLAGVPGRRSLHSRPGIDSMKTSIILLRKTRIRRAAQNQGVDLVHRTLRRRILRINRHLSRLQVALPVPPAG